MTKKLMKIGFGGGCHWCTEAVFQSLKGVLEVKQGWIASEGEAAAFSEAVIVEYDPLKIPLIVLMEVHLRTHKSRSNHSMRKKYRSAIYVFDEELPVETVLKKLQLKFEDKLITQILPYKDFKPSEKNIENYYYKNPQKPFCENFINPKLRLLIHEFSSYTKKESLKHLSE